MQHYEPLFFKEEKFKLLAAKTYELPLHRIANSTWLKKKLDEMQGIKDTPVINHAIDHDIFYPRSKKNRNKGKLRIVSLGKMVEWKGIYDLFNAMELVLKVRNDVELVLYGTKKLSAKYSKIPHIYVLSPSDNELAELYSDSDVLVSASWYESFPLPPLEAMACGLPVITTPYGTEDYAFDGVNAIVVPPQDPKVLAEAIIRLLDDKDLREKLSKEGLNTAKKFTWDKTTDKVEELFKNALK
jgi:glycosyltransferase involved in cell wall biosynthesis